MLPRRNALKTTIRAAVLGIALGAAVGFAMALMGDIPVAPITVSMATMLGLIVPLVTSSMLADLRLARLGSLEDKRAAAAKPLGRFTVASARAAVAIEAGDMERAERAIARIPQVALKDGVVSLVRARYALARGEPNALEALLAWEAPKLRIRVGVGETCRYGAYLLASALVSLPDDDERRRRIATRLLAAPDPEERAYGAWLVAFDDDDGNALAPLRLVSRDLLLGAVLARHEGLSEVASTLEARAAKLALQGSSGPYRGSSSVARSRPIL